MGLSRVRRSHRIVPELVTLEHRRPVSLLMFGLSKATPSQGLNFSGEPATFIAVGALRPISSDLELKTPQSLSDTNSATSHQPNQLSLAVEPPLMYPHALPRSTLLTYSTQHPLYQEASISKSGPLFINEIDSNRISKLSDSFSSNKFESYHPRSLSNSSSVPANSSPGTLDLADLAVSYAKSSIPIPTAAVSPNSNAMSQSVSPTNVTSLQFSPLSQPPSSHQINYTFNKDQRITLDKDIVHTSTATEDPVISFMDGPRSVPGGSPVDSVGDFVWAWVQGPNGEQIKSVTWSFANAIDPYSYVFFKEYSDSNELTSPITHTNVNDSSDQLQFYWNDKEAINTISADVTYSDSTKGFASIDISVMKPTVNSFTLEYKSMSKVANYTNVGMTTFDQSTQKGNIFKANVSTIANLINCGGSFAFLQFVRINYEKITWKDNTAESLSSNGQYWLDDFKDSDNVFLVGYSSNYYPPSTFNIGIPESMFGSDDYIYDTPVLAVPVSRFETGGNYGVALSMSLDFKTYLIYNPTEDTLSNGIWVALSMIEWSMLGSMTYIGPANTLNRADYINRDNWTAVNFTPAASGTKNGVDPDDAFRDWSDYSSHHTLSI